MTIQYSLQLNGHTFFKDDESYVDPESRYAPSRRVFGCPSTEFGVRIPLQTQALPATADITLDYSPVHLGKTPRQICHYSFIASRTCVLLELNFIIECCAQHLLGGYLSLPAIPTSLVHCAFTSSTCSSLKIQLYYVLLL
jgi:hypothetical protein